jgi:hypothetical protein
VEGYDVITSDECKLGHVVGTIGDNVVVEHGTLRKSKHLVPRTFAHVDEGARVVRLTIPKEIVEESPKLNGEPDEHAVAVYYGLAEGEPAPETEGYGELLPDDPAETAEDDARRAGIPTATEERLDVRTGDDPALEQGTTSPGLLGSRTPRG